MFSFHRTFFALATEIGWMMINCQRARAHTHTHTVRQAYHAYGYVRGGLVSVSFFYVSVHRYKVSFKVQFSENQLVQESYFKVILQANFIFFAVSLVFGVLLSLFIM